jgi:geranylgeranyl transferase type-2 subunit alpha
LAREVARFSEALAQDPDARWPLLMTARLKEAQLSLGLTAAVNDGGSSDLKAEVQAAYQRLAEIDPMRAGYYADAAAGKAFVVVQALGTL